MVLETLHIETGDLQRVEKSLDRVGLAIAGRPDQNDPALPRDLVSLIRLARLKELRQVILNLLLQLCWQNQVVKISCLNGLKKGLVLMPVAIIEDQHLAANL